MELHESKAGDTELVTIVDRLVYLTDMLGVLANPHNVIGTRLVAVAVRSKSHNR